MAKVIWGFRAAAVLVFVGAAGLWAADVRHPAIVPTLSVFLVIYFVASVLNVWMQFQGTQRRQIPPPPTATKIGLRDPQNEPPPPTAP